MTSILDHGQPNTAKASARASVIRSRPSGAALGTGRRSGGALVAVLQPADLGDDHDTPALRRLDVPRLGTGAAEALMRARRVLVPRVLTVTYTLGTTVLGDLQYSYDAAGNRSQVGGAWARTGLPQPLTSASYNANNQQLTFGGQTLAYDLNGNLTSDGTSTYTWDARNRLAAITGPVSATFVYDATGRRARKTITGTVTYDGVNPIQEVSGAAAASILTGLGIDEYFVRADTSRARALLTDALGSTVALTDTSGTVQTQYIYEPFGQAITTGATNSNPFQYTGRENDGTRLYFYRSRYYQPSLGRFLGEDVIGRSGAEGERGNDKEVDGHHVAEMSLQECPPRRRRCR